MGDGRPAWLPDLVREVCDEPGVEFAVAFGSQVAGESRPESDVDVAVKFADELAEHEQFQLLCSLSGSLQRSNAPFVDLSDVETLPVAVAHRALDGEFVCGDGEAFRRYKEEIDAEYRDREDEIRRHRRDVIDRISEGGHRGR